MKFFDFLQDVTCIGAVLAVSTFLIDSENAASFDSQVSGFSAGVMDSTTSTSDFLDPIDSSESTMGLDLFDSLDEFGSDPSSARSDQARESTPAPLDLEMLERSLTEQLGLPSGSDTQFGEPPMSEPQNSVTLPGHRSRASDSSYLPEAPAHDDVQPHETYLSNRASRPASQWPASPSHPVSEIDRSFDDLGQAQADFFGIPTNSQSAAPAPERTRRLGPVDFLTVPID